MAEHLPKGVPLLWVKCGERRAEYVCLSAVEGWVSHWDLMARRSRRCGGADCWLCAGGSPKVLRFVVMVLDSSGNERLLELRERHRKVLADWLAEGGSVVGVRFWIRKEGAAKNAAVELRACGRDQVVAREIGRLVSSLGLPAILCQAEQNVRTETSGEVDPTLRLR